MGTIMAVEAVSKFLKATSSVGDAVHTPISPNRISDEIGSELT